MGAGADAGADTLMSWRGIGLLAVFTIFLILFNLSQQVRLRSQLHRLQQQQSFPSRQPPPDPTATCWQVGADWSESANLVTGIMVMPTVGEGPCFETRAACEQHYQTRMCLKQEG